jgi:hypothetical protein
MENKVIDLRLREDLPDLPQGPSRGGVGRRVDVEEAATAYLERDKDVEDAEGRGHHHTEITGHECLGMSAHERRPALPTGPGRGSSSVRPRSIYRRTMRGHTRRPRLRRSSAAMRSSPQVGLSRAMAAISSWISAGSSGQPGHDRQHQNSRNALRCHRTSVGGCTIVRASRQAKQRASKSRVRRTGSDARRGFTWRYRYSANCFRRKRFSAARAVRDRMPAPTNRTRSLAITPRTRAQCFHGCSACMTSDSAPSVVTVLVLGREGEEFTRAA